MATCLSQLYNENKRGIRAGYAKFETFPIWSIPLKHPVNIAYEAATADLNDVNMIDPFHLEAYGKTAVNYNRDVEIFPVLNALFEGIYGENPYKSPTDMGVNMAGFCICDDDVCCQASKDEIIRRYYTALCDYANGKATDSEILAALIKNYREQVTDAEWLPDLYKTIDEKFHGDCEAYVNALYNKSLLMKGKPIYFNKKSYKKDLGVQYGVDLSDFASKLNEARRTLTQEINEQEKLLCAAVLRMEMDMPNYSDANFTMRMTYGQIGEYTLGGRPSG